MSIVYDGNVTFIQNGQSITADNLNAPSVDLKERTVEIKRDSDQSKFRADYSTDCEVVLTSDNNVDSSLTVKTQIKNDGTVDEQPIKYYLPELNNLNFSIYSKADIGSRYVVPGSDISDLFSDSTDGSNPVFSTGLSVAGDGIFAKIPLKFTSGGDDATFTYPDDVYPKTKDQSLAAEYYNEAPSATLVKLPQRTIMDLAASPGSAESTSTFLTRLNDQFVEFTFTIDATSGALTITRDADPNQSIDMRITGTQEGARCTVTHILSRESDGSGVRLQFSAATCPLYTENSSVRKSALGLAVSLVANNVELVTSQVPITNTVFDLGYFIVPQILDPDYAYIPLIRLTENSLLIANREVSLTTRTLSSGTNINVHGDVVAGTTGLTVEETRSYDLDILGNQEVVGEYKGRHSIDVGVHTVDDFGKIDILLSTLNLPDFEFIRSNLQVGDKINLLGVTVYITETFVSNNASPVWNISSLLNSGPDIVTAEVTPSNTPTVGDQINLVFDTAITVITEQSLDIQVRGLDGHSQLLSGSIVARIDLQIT